MEAQRREIICIKECQWKKTGRLWSQAPLSLNPEWISKPMTLRKSFPIPEPQFPHVKQGNITYLSKYLEESNGTMVEQKLAQCLKHFINSHSNYFKSKFLFQISIYF